MKKIMLMITVLLFAGLMASAQFLKDQSNVYLKVSTDKIGIGTAASTDKVTIQSISGEIPLGIVGISNHSSPFITLYNSNKVAIWKLYAMNDWFTIGSTLDSANALISGKIKKRWIRFNATGSFTRLLGTSGTIGTFTSTTGTITTLGSTTGTITTLNSTLGTVATLNSDSARFNKFEVIDTTGIILKNAAGDRFRLHVSASGVVLLTAITP